MSHFNEASGGEACAGMVSRGCGEYFEQPYNKGGIISLGGESEQAFLTSFPPTPKICSGALEGWGGRSTADGQGCSKKGEFAKIASPLHSWESLPLKCHPQLNVYINWILVCTSQSIRKVEIKQNIICFVIKGGKSKIHLAVAQLKSLVVCRNASDVTER